MKIKSVDIVGFRAYAQKGDGQFDFCNPDGSVSNFVAIYAPNGFGKSSFYDAMEWAITNNISRYIRDSQRGINSSVSLYLNTSSSSQRILKNRYISESAPSYVSVKTTDKKNNYRRSVRRPPAGQRDYTYDPSNTVKSTKHLADIFLSQDAIDAFLKEERPEQRYERFMLDFGEGDEKYRASLFSALKSCNREIKILNDSISDLESSLEEPALDFSVEKVNETIREINNLGNNFPLIDPAFSELQQTELRSMLSKHIVEIESKITSLGNLDRSVDLSVESLPRVEEYRNLSAKLRAQLQVMHANRSQLDEISKAKAAREDCDIRLQGVMSELEQVAELLSNYAKIHEIVNDIAACEAELETVNSSVDLETVTVNTYLQSIDSMRRKRAELDTELASLLDSFERIDSRYQDIQQAESLISGYKSKITDLENRQSLVSSLRQSLRDEYLRCFNLKIDGSLISSEVQAFLKPDPDFVVSYNQSIELKASVAQQISNLEEQAKSLGSQSKDLYSLLNLARSLLSESLSDECPVCSAKYDSYAVLLDRIQSNGSIEAALSSILKNTEDARNRISQLDSFLVKGDEYLNSLKRTLLEQITEKVVSADGDLEQIAREILDAQRESAIRTDSLHRLSALVGNMPKDDYTRFISSSIDAVRQKIQAANELFGSETSLMQTAKQRKEQFFVRKVALDTRLDAYRGSELYSLYSSLKASYLLEGDDLNGEFSRKHEELTQQRSALKTEIDGIDIFIKYMESNISESGRFLSDILVSEKIISLSNELAYSEDSVSKLEASLRSLVQNPGSSISDLFNSLSDKKKDLERQLKDLGSGLLWLNILLAQLDDVLPFFKYRRAREEIESKLSSLSKMQRLVVSLTKELRESETKLKERINNFFYTDLITSIYSKIDPHPFFKTVSFECVFPEEERPRLEVYLYEEGSSQPISPGLYFSSAQLNILSLSIFLAKALHIEHDGKPVRSILIDDPIHSMDSINVLSVIDLLRNISMNFDRQIILSTHDENFYELLKLKVPEDRFGSRFIRFKSFGVVENDVVLSG
ncbi:SMC family ATPase [Pseudomonas aeruginosa]|uniref:SMC family ATPase n=1 Tax=Pseudomonas aeruginosa TaxID=287 RepID=UPI0029019F72|nr:SMC family ATPase [Pseudomonas aeruginosa]MDU0701888.1 SMC family ATPase [Pseudomonas aeruginosa]